MDKLEIENNNNSNSSKHPQEDVIASVNDDQDSKNNKAGPSIPQQPNEEGEEETESHSPSTSQVSVSSVAPTLVAALLHQHEVNGSRHVFYENLTPVTRNTGSMTPPHSQGPVLVSPSDVRQEELDPEHLSLPSVAAGSAAVSSSGLRLAGRARSSTVSGHDGRGPNDDELALRPVPLPARNKFFSFSGRDQYRDELADAAGLTEAVSSIQVDDKNNNIEPNPTSTLLLTPYQPPRDDAMDDLPPEEVLGQIFCTRRQRPDQQSLMTMGGDESKQHRLSLSEQQQQISQTSHSGDAPSLHLAHHLGTDNASFSTHTTLNTLDSVDLDNSGMYLNGSSSSSRNTSWTMSRSESKSHNNPVIVEGFPEDEEQPQQDPSQRDDADTTMAIDGKYQREQAALEWLQSLPSQQIAEAASSKFLCQKLTSPATSPHRPSLAMP